MKTLMTSKFVILSALFVALFVTKSVAQDPHLKNPPDPTATSEGGVRPTPPVLPVTNTSLLWKLGAPVSPWNLSDDRWTELPVTVSDITKTQKILLVQSTLVDTDSPSGTVLHTSNICLHKERKDGPCAQELDLNPPKGATGAVKQTIWLEVKKEFVPVGTFTGSLFFDTEPFTDTQSIALKVQQTRLRRQVLGIVVIVAGVVLAWLVTVFGRSRIARDQALMPALALLDKLRDLKNTVDQFPPALKPNVSASAATIATLIGSLSVEALDKQDFLPPVIPAFGPTVTKTAEYQTFLTQASQEVEDLDILFSEGFDLLAKRWNANLSGPELTDLQTAVGAIDQLSLGLPTDPQALRSQVIAALQAWNAAHAAIARALGALPQAIVPASPGQKTFLAVRLEVQSITILFWLIWGVLSVVIGALMLIVPVPGFGSITDFVRCFLWGFGLPVAGNSIQNLTVGSLNTQLGVSITRS